MVPPSLSSTSTGPVSFICNWIKSPIRILSSSPQSLWLSCRLLCRASHVRMACQLLPIPINPAPHLDRRWPPIRDGRIAPAKNACITGAAISSRRGANPVAALRPSPIILPPVLPQGFRPAWRTSFATGPPDAGAHPPAECQRQSADYLMVLDSAARSAPSCRSSAVSADHLHVEWHQQHIAAGQRVHVLFASPFVWRHHAVLNQRAVPAPWFRSWPASMPSSKYSM